MIELIAECSTNHGGRMALAKEFIDRFAEAGAETPWPRDWSRVWVLRWRGRTAQEHRQRPGDEGEHAMPESWDCVPWKAQGGYGSQRKDGTLNDNPTRERIWFSPHCLTATQPGLFGEAR